MLALHIFEILVVLRTCFGTSIMMEAVEKRLCQSDYVFKFRVISNVTSECYTPQQPITNQPSSTSSNSTPSPSPLPPTTLPNNIPNMPTTTSVNTGGPSVKSQSTVTPLASSTVKNKPANHLHGVGCYMIYYHNVSIMKSGIYKGNGSLELMDSVRVIEGKEYYEATIRADLHFTDLLKLNKKYLFLGRQIPNVSPKDNVFLSNPYNVEEWNKVQNILQNFNFTRDCM